MLLRWIDRLSAVAIAIAMGLTSVLIAATCYEVAARHFFNAPTLWAFDAVSMLNGAVFMLAGAYTLREDGHVRIDFFSVRMPHRFQHAVLLLIYALVLLPALGWAIWAGSVRTWTAFTTGELEKVSAWRPVIWPFFFSILAGLVCLWLQIAAQCARHALAVLQGPADKSAA